MDEPSGGMPRWLLILTAIVGLAGGVLYAGTQYYEFARARAEAEKDRGRGKDGARPKGDTPREARPIDYAGAVYVGTMTDNVNPGYARLRIDTTTGEKFAGRWARLTVDEKVKLEVRVTGEIKGEKITFSHGANDVIFPNGPGQPTKFAATIGPRDLTGLSEPVNPGAPRARFDLTRK